MSSLDKLKELRKKEREIDTIFAELKEEKKKEVIEKVKELLQQNKTYEAKLLIQKIDELKEVQWERNERVLMQLQEMFELPKDSVEMEYEQLKMETEKKESKKEVENLFVTQLQKRGFRIEERKSDVLKLRQEEQVLYFFELETNKSLIDEIQKKRKYTSLLIGLETLQQEEEAEQEIRDWFNASNDEKKEVFQKYLKLNITSKERLNSDEESIKKVRIA